MNFLRDSSRNLSRGFSRSCSWNSGRSSRRNPRKNSRRIPRENSWRHPKGTPKGISEGIPQKILEEIPRGITKRTSVWIFWRNHTIPDETSGTSSEETSAGWVPEVISDEGRSIPGGTSKENPGGNFEGTPAFGTSSFSIHHKSSHKPNRNHARICLACANLNHTTIVPLFLQRCLPRNSYLDYFHDSLSSSLQSSPRSSFWYSSSSFC